MGDAPEPARAQELAHRVWHLPHVRYAVFDELCSLQGLNNPRVLFERKHFLAQFLTFNRETSLDVARLMYPLVVFDNSPWDCTDSDRKRAYAAGVLGAHIHGCVPRLAGWDLGSLIDFFPNLLHISFSTMRLRLDRKPGYTCADGSWLSGTVTIGKEFEVLEPEELLELHHPDNSRIVLAMAIYGRNFVVTEANELQVPAMLLLPLKELTIAGRPVEEEPGLFALLEYRKGAGIPTGTLDFELTPRGVADGTYARCLIDGMPPGLKNLVLSYYSDIRVSCSLDAMMGPLDARHCPDVRHVSLLITFDQDVPSEGSAEAAPHRWSDVAFPTELCIHVGLVFSDHEHDTRLSAEFVDDQMLRAIPVSWIERTRERLSKVKGHLSVETFCKEVQPMTPILPSEPPKAAAELKRLLPSPNDGE